MSVKALAMRDAFLNRIWESMTNDIKIFFISADFGSPVLDKIRNDFPDRFINVGIAEQNLINITSGLALEGFKVFAYAIAPFITMRCYEQIRISLALLSEVRPLNVTLIGVGAGYSYVVSGPTHQCYEDITLMRALVNFTVLSPSDHVTANVMFDRCVDKTGLKYVRMDAQVLPVIYNDTTPEINKGFHVHEQGDSTCLVATGYMLHTAKQVAKELLAKGHKIGIIDLFDLTTFNADELSNALSNYKSLVTLEEGFRGRGGMDSMLFEFTARRGLKIQILNLGVNPGYRFEIGNRVELHEKVGIGPKSVLTSIIDHIENLK